MSTGMYKHGNKIQMVYFTAIAITLFLTGCSSTKSFLCTRFCPQTKNEDSARHAYRLKSKIERDGRISVNNMWSDKLNEILRQYDASIAEGEEVIRRSR